MTNTTKQAENPIVTEAVNKFLGWKLPANFYPDHAIVFHKDKCEFDRVGGWPIGTNLFTADQAKAMFEHCLQNTRADLVKPIQAEPVGYAVSSELQELQTDDSVYLYLTCESSERYDAPLYSADTVRALQLEAIRKTLEFAHNESVNSGQNILDIDPEEILNSLNDIVCAVPNSYD